MHCVYPTKYHRHRGQRATSAVGTGVLGRVSRVMEVAALGPFGKRLSRCCYWNTLFLTPALFAFSAERWDQDRRAGRLVSSADTCGSPSPTQPPQGFCSNPASRTASH